MPGSKNTDSAGLTTTIKQDGFLMSRRNSTANHSNQSANNFPAVLLLLTLVATGCTSPQNIQEQESTGDTAVTQPEPKPLANTDWKAQSILGRPAGSADSTLSFMADGKVVGSGGCNGYQGNVNVGENTIAFGALATTRMMCSPPVSGQEIVFLEALGLAKLWQQSADTLELVDENNEVVLQFTRQ
jgi:putative lipoprotein